MKGSVSFSSLMYFWVVVLIGQCLAGVKLYVEVVCCRYSAEPRWTAKRPPWCSESVQCAARKKGQQASALCE